MFSSSRLVTPLILDGSFPSLHEFQPGEVAQGLIGAHAVAGMFPPQELAVQRQQFTGKGRRSNRVLKKRAAASEVARPWHLHHVPAADHIPHSEVLQHQPAAQADLLGAHFQQVYGLLDSPVFWLANRPGRFRNLHRCCRSTTGRGGSCSAPRRGRRWHWGARREKLPSSSE